MLPIDCVGEIIRYFCKTGEEVNVFLLLSKDVFRYIQLENPGCCEKAVFTIQETPPRVLTYCFRLNVRQCTSLYVNPLDEEFLQYFPNLEALVVLGNCMKLSSLKYCISNLFELELSNLSLLEFENFNCISNLRRLELDTNLDYEASFLDYFPHLEELKLHTMNKLANDLPVMKKLKKLEIRVDSKMTGVGFSSVPNVEELRITNTWLDEKNLKYLKNLKVLDVDLGLKEEQIRKHLHEDAKKDCVITITTGYSWY